MTAVGGGTKHVMATVGGGSKYKNGCCRRWS